MVNVALAFFWSHVSCNPVKVYTKFALLFWSLVLQEITGLTVAGRKCSDW